MQKKIFKNHKKNPKKTLKYFKNSNVRNFFPKNPNVRNFFQKPKCQDPESGLFLDPWLEIQNQEITRKEDQNNTPNQPPVVSFQNQQYLN